MELYFLDGHLRKCIKIDRLINASIAIASSGSLAAWLLLNNYSKVFSTIIVITELIMVVKPYFPYQDRILEIRELADKLDYIYQDMECTWFSIFEVKISNEEIIEEYSKYEKKWLACGENYFKKDSLPNDDEKINVYAETMKNNYFKNFLDRRTENGKVQSEKY